MDIYGNLNEIAVRLLLMELFGLHPELLNEKKIFA